MITEYGTFVFPPDVKTRNNVVHFGSTTTSYARFPAPPNPKLPKTTRTTVIPNTKLTVPPATKLPALPVTNIQCTRQILGQIRLCREWEEKMERLNENYGLHCFSDSE